jgi:hypothetical protein
MRLARAKAEQLRRRDLSAVVLSGNNAIVV